MKLTIMYDNRSYKEGWETGWGFSCVADNGKDRVLFDTGDNPYKLVGNFKKSEIDIKQIEAITFSHQHWDHVDGLEGFLNINKSARVYIPVSFPKKIMELVSENGNDIIHSGQKVEEISDGIYIMPVLKKIFKPAEQGLVLKINGGLALVTGCAHPGIVNMVRKTNELFNRKVKIILGGFHLSTKSDSKVKKIIKKLKEEGVSYFAPSHCTGRIAIDLFKEECGKKYIQIGCGKSLELNSLEKENL